MTIRNRLYNWWYGIKRYKGKYCRNVGRYKDRIVKYDWSKPTMYVSKFIKY